MTTLSTIGIVDSSQLYCGTELSVPILSESASGRSRLDSGTEA
jgi:hypothetical protein